MGSPGRDHHANAHINAHVARASHIIGALEKHQVAGFGLLFRDFGSLLPQAVGRWYAPRPQPD